MQDQHTKISGYRDLSQAEIDLMNECKVVAAQCQELISKLELIDTDKRALALGKTNLQQGFMWTVRSIAKPTTFG